MFSSGSTELLATYISGRPERARHRWQRAAIGVDQMSNSVMRRCSFGKPCTTIAGTCMDGSSLLFYHSIDMMAINAMVVGMPHPICPMGAMRRWSLFSRNVEAEYCKQSCS